MLFDRRQSPTYLVSQLAKEFARALQVRAEGLGFSAGQFPILLELWEEQGLTQKQLLERVAVEQATMANTLSRMERDGLIERKPHPNDRRAQLVFLTAKGRGCGIRPFPQLARRMTLFSMVFGVSRRNYCWNSFVRPWKMPAAATKAQIFDAVCLETVGLMVYRPG